MHFPRCSDLLPPRMFDPSHRGSLTPNRLIPGGRYEKRIGQTKNAFIWDPPARCGKPARCPGPQDAPPSYLLSGEGEPSLPQHLRRINTVFASEGLGKPGRNGGLVVMAAEMQCISILLYLCGIYHSIGGRRPRNVNFPGGLSRESSASAVRPPPHC
jgi:hypothetical protein